MFFLNIPLKNKKLDLKKISQILTKTLLNQPDKKCVIENKD